MPHRLYDNCVLKTYADTAAWFSRARNKERGRPYNGWGMVVQEGQDFIVRVYKRDICRIASDNTLTMLIDPNTGSAISNTLSCSLHRLAPISWQRSGMRRYRILPLRSMSASDSYWEAVKTAPELYVGLKFDLSTGKPINAKADMVKRVNKQARLEWLRVKKRFQQNILLRAKMGVFDAVQQELSAPNPKFKAKNGKMFANHRPDWGDDKWLDLLYTSMRDNQYSKTLLAGFLLTMPSVVWSGHRQKTMQEKIQFTIQRVLDTQSVELRTRFGVFSDEVTKDGNESK